MQEINDTFRDFVRRTDTLAFLLGIDVGDLPEHIGVSRASLFRYRSGKAPISGKAWIKLAFAETNAGIATPLEQILDKALPQKGMAETIRNMMDVGDWNENLDGQLKAFLGQKALARSLLESWNSLENLLGNFFEQVQASESLAAGLRPDLVLLQSSVKSFKIGLESFVETTAKIDQG